MRAWPLAHGQPWSLPGRRWTSGRGTIGGPRDETGAPIDSLQKHDGVRHTSAARQRAADWPARGETHAEELEPELAAVPAAFHMIPRRRIQRLGTHLVGAEANAPVLLTDEEVKQFIVDGFLVKKIDDLSREFHLGIYDKCVSARRIASELPGRSRLQGGQEASHVAALDDFIFPSIPELGQVYASPVLRGATASLVGEDYVMHPHRHMHSGMGGMDQNFHKDGHHVPMRHHRPRWIMGMYFCTDVTIEMVRRRHNREHRMRRW